MGRTYFCTMAEANFPPDKICHYRYTAACLISGLAKQRQSSNRHVRVVCCFTSGSSTWHCNTTGFLGDPGRRFLLFRSIASSANAKLRTCGCDVDMEGGNHGVSAPTHPQTTPATPEADIQRGDVLGKALDVVSCRNSTWSWPCNWLTYIPNHPSKRCWAFKVHQRWQNAEVRPQPSKTASLQLETRRVHMLRFGCAIVRIKVRVCVDESMTLDGDDTTSVVASPAGNDDNDDNTITDGNTTVVPAPAPQ